MKADCLRCWNYKDGECKAFFEKIFKPILIKDCKVGIIDHTLRNPFKLEVKS